MSFLLLPGDLLGGSLRHCPRRPQSASPLETPQGVRQSSLIHAPAKASFKGEVVLCCGLLDIAAGLTTLAGMVSVSNLVEVVADPGDTLRTSGQF